jgi:hypothetical protein
VPYFSHLTPCTRTTSSLYFANSLAAAVSEPAVYRLRTFQVPYLMPIFRCLNHTKSISLGLRLPVRIYRNKIRFYGQDLSPGPTPKLEDHPLSAVGCLFNIFAATLHNGGRSLIRNPRMRNVREACKIVCLTIV